MIGTLDLWMYGRTDVDVCICANSDYSLVAPSTLATWGHLQDRNEIKRGQHQREAACDVAQAEKEAQQCP